VVGGMAGEVGRAFYYQRATAGPEPAGRKALVDHLHPEDRLPGARRETQRLTRRRVERWVEAAASSGHRGWRVLDVVYAEQRVARWGRTQVPCIDADFVAGFAGAHVLRGLTSLPLADRTSDGFHRRFVAERLPELPLSPPPPPPPAPSRARALAGRARRRLRPPPPATDAFFLDAWQRLPSTRDWLLDEVLAAPLITTVMGEAWARATRDGLLRGERRATEQARLAAGPVALAAALAQPFAAERISRRA